MKILKQLNNLYDLPKNWQIPFNNLVDVGAYILCIVDLVYGFANGSWYVEFLVELTDCEGNISTYVSFRYYVGTAAFAELTKHFWSEGIHDFSSLIGHEELVEIQHGPKLAYVASRSPLNLEKSYQNVGAVKTDEQ